MENEYVIENRNENDFIIETEVESRNESNSIHYKKVPDKTANHSETIGEQKKTPHQGIVVEHVYKSFGKEHVLKDVNLVIEPGHIFGVVGNNGSGKTVLMKCICGFMHPDKGKVYVNGKRIGFERDFPDSIGIIIETPGFLTNISGYKNLKILASLKGKIGKKEILDTLELVGLDKKMRKKVANYSLGMRQRLGIAQAIMENPDVLILDEPFNGLDRTGVEQMRALLNGLKREGKAILLASHNAQDIEELCDEVHNMEDAWD